MAQFLGATGDPLPALFFFFFWLGNSSNNTDYHSHKWIKFFKFWAFKSQILAAHLCSQRRSEPCCTLLSIQYMPLLKSHPWKSNLKKKKLKLDVGVCARSKTNSSLALLLSKAHPGLVLKLNFNFTPRLGLQLERTRWELGPLNIME